MTHIAEARRAAEERFGDTLPLQLLERARQMAVRQGWRRSAPPTPRLTREPLGSDVLVPAPNQEVGSGARPSARDPHLLSEVLGAVVDRRGWKKQIDIGSVAARWPQIVGPAIAQHCSVENFSDDGVLTLRAATVSWQTQITALLAHLDARLAQEVGEGVVKDIRVLGPHRRSWKHGPYSVPGRGVRDTYD